MESFMQCGLTLGGPIKLTLEFRATSLWFDVETNEDVFLFTKGDTELMVRTPVGSEDSERIKGIIADSILEWRK